MYHQMQADFAARFPEAWQVAQLALFDFAKSRPILIAEIPMEFQQIYQ